VKLMVSILALESSGIFRFVEAIFDGYNAVILILTNIFAGIACFSRIFAWRYRVVVVIDRRRKKWEISAQGSAESRTS
jgi:hypothetical protein